jgi:predicted ester cyclase
MPTDDHKTLGRNIIAAINAGDLAALDTVFATAYVDRSPFPGATPDREGFKQGLARFRSVFPDLRYTIEDEIVVGDRLVHRLTAKGTQKGEFMGIAPTGKQATWSEIHIGRVVDGKVVEHWGVGDQHGMMEQLGLVAVGR